MKSVLIIGVAGCLIVRATIAFGYEPGTHGKLSDTAAQKSALVVSLPASNTTILQDWGLNPYAEPSQVFPDIQAQPNEWVYLDPDHNIKFNAKSQERE